MNETRTHPTIDAIQRVMDEQGISQSELARRLDWERMKVQRRITGGAELTVAELEAIASVLGVPASQFLPSPAGES